MDNKKAIILVVAIATLNVPLGTWILNLRDPTLLFGLSSDFWAGALLSADIVVMWLLVYFFYSQDNQFSAPLPAPLPERAVVPTRDVTPIPSANMPTRKKDGYWFYFDCDGIEIALHHSTYLGNETVYFNDNPVSELNNLFGFNKSHHILYKGKKYKLVTEFVDLFGYKLECVLYVEKRKHSRETKGLIVGGAKDALRQLGFTIALGMLCGAVIGGFIYLGFFLFT